MALAIIFKMGDKNKYVGVIGSGSFGTAISNLLAENKRVLLYTRREEVKEAIEKKGLHKGHKMHPNIEVTMDLDRIGKECTLIFPVVDSANFRKMMQTLSPFLKPRHILIHGTKGLNFKAGYTPNHQLHLSRTEIRTMTEVILEESVVLRVGCLSGPNLASEIAQGLPAATVIASRFKEVIKMGMDALKSRRFRVYGSYDVLGVELAGVLKNVLALSSGMLEGRNLGENCRAMLITRGLGEMVKLSKALGSDGTAFLGIAGIGDMIATCSSNKSRNFTVGNRLAKGETLEYIIETMNEVAEGVKTTKMAYSLAQHYHIETPIIRTIYHILYENASIDESLMYLMEHHHEVDADYL